MGQGGIDTILVVFFDPLEGIVNQQGNTANRTTDDSGMFSVV